MNLNHHANLTHNEFIRCYEHECKTPLELALFDRLNHPMKYATVENVEYMTNRTADDRLSDALDALDDIAIIARRF